MKKSELRQIIKEEIIKILENKSKQVEYQQATKRLIQKTDELIERIKNDPSYLTAIKDDTRE